MRWMPILIVSLCCAGAVPAQAGSGAGAVATAAQPAAARTGKSVLPRAARLAAMELEIGGGAVAVVQPAVRARLAGDMPGVWLLPEDPRLAGRGALRRGEGGSGSAFSYPLSETVSLGLRYRFLTDEDLVGFEAAQSGSLKSEYANHRFVLRARWQF